MKFPTSFVLSIVLSAVASMAHATQATDTNIVVTGDSAGATPFISKLTLTVSDLAALDRVKFAVRPKDGSVTRPLAATYSQVYLDSRGYVDTGAGQITLPVFGLYANHVNTVTLTYFFHDGSSKTALTSVSTAPFDDPCHYDNPTVFQPRTATRALSYDFVLIFTNCSHYSPVVIDTDGAIRWVGTAGAQNHAGAFFDNAIYLADSGVVRIELDGAVTKLTDLPSIGATALHHSINRGKSGVILDAHTEDWVASVNIEIDRFGNVLNRWSLGDIIREEMIAGGDDPSRFVRNSKGVYGFNSPEDWFHNNSVCYRKSDNSLIVSSRENFVIALDYDSKAIKWILGDPTKQWYQYPSLRKFALKLPPGSHAPIGQHAVSITKDDHLMLFDNGQRSQNHSPFGASRNYSAPRKYELDLVNKVATEVWHYYHEPGIRSPFRSSVYEDAPSNYLVHYSNAPSYPRIVGLSAAGDKVFEYGYGARAFRSVPTHWERLLFIAPASAEPTAAEIFAEPFSSDED